MNSLVNLASVDFKGCTFSQNNGVTYRDVYMVNIA